MINCRQFVDIMRKLEELHLKQNALDVALASLCGGEGHGGFYLYDYQDMIVNLLTHELNDDKYHWLEYFIYEKDWLHNLKASDITYEDGTCAHIDSWSDAYHFIVSDVEVDRHCKSYIYDEYYDCGRCLGTRERDFCSCEGNKLKCTQRSK